MAEPSWPPPVPLTITQCVGCGQQFGIVTFFGPLPSEWRCPPCEYWWDRRN